MAKNLCGKIVTPENAYEVWQSNDGRYTTFVLKKYKNPEAEEKDPYARWYVCTKSSVTSQRGEYGDTYATEAKRNAHRIANPLVKSYDFAYLEQTYHIDREAVEALLPRICEKYTIFDVSPELLEREVAKTYEQIVLDEAILQHSVQGQDDQTTMVIE